MGTVCTPSTPSTHCQQPQVNITADVLWQRLVHAHQHKLCSFIQRRIGHADDAEELAQQAFVEAVKGYAGFRQEAELSTWLYGIARNLVRNYLSRAPGRRYEFCGEDCLHDQQDHAPAPAELLEREQQLQALSRLLGELSLPLHEVLWLVTVEGLSYEDAARQLSIPIGTVRSRVSRARAQLRNRMDTVYG